MKSTAALLAAVVVLGGIVSPVVAETAIEHTVWEAAGVAPVPPVRVPSLTLPDIGTWQVSLADFKGRVVMLYFWATW